MIFSDAPINSFNHIHLKWTHPTLKLDQSITEKRDIKALTNRKANSVDPEEMAHNNETSLHNNEPSLHNNEPSLLDLHNFVSVWLNLMKGLSANNGLQWCSIKGHT